MKHSTNYCGLNKYIYIKTCDFNKPHVRSKLNCEISSQQTHIRQVIRLATLHLFRYLVDEIAELGNVEQVFILREVIYAILILIGRVFREIQFAAFIYPHPAHTEVRRIIAERVRYHDAAQRHTPVFSLHHLFRQQLQRRLHLCQNHLVQRIMYCAVVMSDYLCHSRN